MSTDADNWDQHWAPFGTTAEWRPTPHRNGYLLRISGNATCCYLPEPTRLGTSARRMLCARKCLSISKNPLLFCGMLLHTCKPAAS